MLTIPEGFRRLAIGEAIRGSDVYQRVIGREVNRDLRPVSETNCEYIGRIMGRGGFAEDDEWQILRKIESPWISVKERLPEEKEYPVATWDGEQVSSARLGYSGGPRKDVTVAEHQTIAQDDRITHWMSLPKAPQLIAPPIFINEGSTKREIQFNKDGSIKVGCVTVDAPTFDKIIERRKEVMK